tara:strand:+ start:271 stop:474 length:204 start_codon:yes stop_codon:yes gene_type:complete
METHGLDMGTVRFGKADLLARPAEKAGLGYSSSLPLDPGAALVSRRYALGVFDDVRLHIAAPFAVGS